MSFTQEAGGLASFTRSNGACSSIAVKICFAMPDWSSVSSKEYTVVNGKVLKLLIRDSRSNVFKFLMNLHHNSFLFAGKSTKM